MSLFLITSFLLGLFWYFLIATVLSLGEKLLVVGLGIPIVFLSLLIVKAAARLERRRLAFFLDLPIHADYQPMPADGWWHRVFVFVTDPTLWRDWLYVLLLVPLGTLDFVIFTLAFCAPLVLVLTPFFSAWMASITLLHFFVVDSWLKALLLIIVGLLWLWIGTYLIAWTTNLHGACAQRLLGIPLSVRMAALVKSRTQALEAALSERQRIAHDLHDGTQQHLLALAMDLGMAKEKLDSEPEAARELIIRAHDQAKRSLAELRDLVRGIYPAILTDRGLDAALSALAGRSPVPVTVTVQIKGRFHELIESTAYFVVAEALTNIAKHSGASTASVLLAQDQGKLIIEVIDNGHGGAAIVPGAGLAGLQNRLAALEGTLTIRSPSGGPSCLKGVLPCV
jgi:signal transduction histidine kinase